MFVHTFGAYFGLGVSFMVSKRGKIQQAGTKFGSTVNSDMFAMIGTLFLWMFWPSFNGALAPGAQQHRVVINTVLALTASCVGAVIASRLLQPGNKLSMVDIQNATLAGGVAVGSSADLVIEPYGALIIGLIAGSLSVFGYSKISPFLERKGLHDTCGVNNLHGMPGVMGGIGGAISAALADQGNYSNELGSIFAGIEEDGRTVGEQGWYQLAALIVTLSISISSGLLTGKILSYQEGVESYGDDHENWNHEESEGEEEKLVEASRV